MDGEGVELVLSRAVELRLKISNCIHKASINTVTNANGNSVASELNSEGKEGKISKELNPNSVSRDEEDDEEDAERLLHIRDALQSLELQLSHLQALQRQQRYEREVALSEIEHSRKMLLDKLKNYKGADLEVIHEASTFVGETVEHSNDLLLPPYPIRPPPSLVLNNHYLSHPALQKSTVNLNKTQNKASRNSTNRVGGFIGAAAKALVTVVGVISVLSLSGFGTKLGKKTIPLNIVDLFRLPARGQKNRSECPPGRVLVRGNGEAVCVVKERVAIPFQSVVAKPDVDYGCG